MNEFDVYVRIEADAVGVDDCLQIALMGRQGGRDAKNSGREEKSPISKAGVRCCRGTAIDINANPSPRVDMKDYGCHRGATLREADKICKDKGLNLCSESQIEADDTNHTGCGFDNVVVWSSTKGMCADKADEPPAVGDECPRVALKGRQSRRTPQDSERMEKKPSDTAAVRCCKGFSIWKPSPRVAMENYGCHENKTLEEAYNICKKKDLNLCSEAQIESDDTAGTGCGFDNEVVWTSTKGTCTDEATPHQGGPGEGNSTAKGQTGKGEGGGDGAGAAEPPKVKCGKDEHVVNNTCEQCPHGKTSSGMDDTKCDATTCVAQRVVNHTCVECPPGTISRGHHDTSMQDTTCKALPAGVVYTQTTKTAADGDMSLSVGSVVNFSVGLKITIDAGMMDDAGMDIEEVNTITNITVAGSLARISRSAKRQVSENILWLKTPLNHSHGSGAEVTTMAHPAAPGGKKPSPATPNEGGNLSRPAAPEGKKFVTGNTE